jgi:beta-aspartyl-peptidase (threonine type)
MRRKFLVSAVLVWLSSPLVGEALQAKVQAEVQVEVRQVLEMQQRAWNQHDLVGFMAGYWNSSDLTFFSGAEVASGWQATLERYRRKYLAGDGEMGKLEFSDLHIEPLSRDAAWVGGSWRLSLSRSRAAPHGLFTLIFRRFPEGWKIVHDHTSAAQ